MEKLLNNGNNDTQIASLSELKLVLGQPVPKITPDYFDMIYLYRINENGEGELLGRVRAPRDMCIEIELGGEDRFYIRTKYANFAILYNNSFKGLYRFDPGIRGKIADFEDKEEIIANNPQFIKTKV